MSLILDALNRSRQDAESVPGLSAEHFIEEPSTVRRFAPWVGLLLAVLLIGWWWFGGDPAENGEQDSQVEQVASVTPSTALSTTPGPDASGAAAEQTRPKPPPTAQKAMPVPPEPAPQPPQTTRPSQPVVAQSAAASAARAAASEGVSDNKSPAPQGSAAQRAALEALYAQSRKAAASTSKSSGQAPVQTPRQSTGKAQPAAPGKAQKAPPAAPATQQTQQETQEKPLNVDELLSMAQQEAANIKLEDHPAPFLVRLSQQVKNDIPSIMYQRHDYSSTRGQSKVTLNGKRLGVGGSPAQGMRVDEILEDSVVLSFRGTQFRLRALNSWVNL